MDKKEKPTPKKPESNKRDNLRFDTSKDARKNHLEMLKVHKIWRLKDRKKKLKRLAKKSR